MLDCPRVRVDFVSLRQISSRRSFISFPSPAIFDCPVRIAPPPNFIFTQIFCYLTDFAGHALKREHEYFHLALQLVP